MAILCYLNTLPGEFVFDDREVIVSNPLVTGPETGPAFLFSSHYWQHVTPTGNLYRPLVIGSYAFNHALGGLNPSGYHAVNVLLHALCSCLVLLLAVALRLPPGASFVAGALFATHPIHTEAVAGIVGRAELMAAAGVLGAWLLHLRGRRQGAGRLAMLGLAFTTALLSKENAVVLPGLMAASDILRIRRGESTWRGSMPSYMVCGLVLAGWLTLRAVVLDPVEAGSIAETPFAGVPSLTRLLTATAVLGRYLWLLGFPLRLSADYSFEQIPLVTSPAVAPVLLSATCLTVLLGLGAHRLMKGRLDGLCALAYLIAVAPVSNVFVPIGTVMAERLQYLPSAAFCIALPGLWTEMRIRSRYLAAGAAGLLILLYGGRSVARNLDWRDQLTLFTVTAETSPRSAKVRYNLGVALEEAGRPEEALAQYEAALRIRPDDARSHHNSGLLLAAMDRLADAAWHLEMAAELDPSLEDVYTSLGAAYAGLGRVEEAEGALLTGLGRNPQNHAALYNLGTLLLSVGRGLEAISYLQRARAVDPAEPDSRYQLGLAYLTSGKPAEAIEEFREALSLMPSLRDAHIHIAMAHLSLGNTIEAEEAAARARAAGLALPPELERIVPPGPTR